MKKYACSWFEPEMGRLLSFLYVEMRSGIPYAFEGRLDYLTILYELFIEVYTYFENCRADGAEPEIRRVRDIVYWYASDYCDGLKNRSIRRIRLRQILSKMQI